VHSFIHSLATLQHLNPDSVGSAAASPQSINPNWAFHLPIIQRRRVFSSLAMVQPPPALSQLGAEIRRTIKPSKSETIRAALISCRPARPRRGSTAAHRDEPDDRPITVGRSDRSIFTELSADTFAAAPRRRIYLSNSTCRSPVRLTLIPPGKMFDSPCLSDYTLYVPCRLIFRLGNVGNDIADNE